MKLFKDLTDKEVAEFKDWARKQYKPFTEIKGIWHPVIQEECANMNTEAEFNVDDLVK